MPSLASQTSTRQQDAARVRGLDRFDLGLLALLSLLSLAVAADALQIAARTDGLWWGLDSPIVPDTAQYLGLVRQSADHWLVGNPFDIAGAPRTLLHPGWVLTGRLTALGLAPGVALILIKPLGVASAFFGGRAYVRRLVESIAARRAALSVALLGLSPIVAALVGADMLRHGGVPVLGTVQRDFLSIARELSPLTQLWGYPWAAITLGLVPIALLAYERGRAHDRRALALAAVCCALASWLHPWQGATVLITIAGVELCGAARRLRRGATAGAQLRWLAPRLLPVGVVGAAPLAYFFLLSVFDSRYRELGEMLHTGFWPLEVPVLALAPLALPAVLAYRLPVASFAQASVRWWPLVGLFVYLQPGGTFRNHAFEGLSIPLATLAVIGVSSLPWRRWGIERRARRAGVALAVAVFCLPALLAHALMAHYSLRAVNAPPNITRDESHALSALDRDPRPGGVLAPLPIGLLVPGLTGREIWSSGLVWSPRPFERADVAGRLFAGRLAPLQARALVRRSGARFLLDGCSGPRVDLTRTLGPLLRSSRPYGCARVYRLR